MFDLVIQQGSKGERERDSGRERERERGRGVDRGSILSTCNSPPAASLSCLPQCACADCVIANRQWKTHRSVSTAMRAAAQEDDTKMATSAAAIPTASRPAALTASPGCVRRVRTDLKTSENRFLGGHHHHQLRQQHCHTLLASSAPPATATYLRWQGKGINPAKLSHITNLLPASLCLQRQTARTRHTPVEPLQAAGSASAANRQRLGQQFALHAQWRLRWSQAQQHSRF